MPASVIGLDIGGANLKAAHSAGPVRSLPFELWRQPTRLPEALRDLLRSLPPAEQLAVTMTGELCDCFESKREGVCAILDAVQVVGGALPIRIWQTDGRLVDVAAARNSPLQTAAANWLALATFAGRFAPFGPALVIDIGSTTTDIVPLLDGRPVPRGRTDPERLRAHELVYTGVRRTPLCALLDAEVAAELFATTLDVYLLLGLLPEDSNDLGTADGRPATRAAAEVRLARMLCADLETSSPPERNNLAQTAMLKQVQLIRTAIGRVGGTLPQFPVTVILSGAGEMLGQSALACKGPRPTDHFPVEGIVSLAEEIGLEASQAACAHALAILASEAAAI
jgi:probable H4MPT-linked C1 transfer pathway protein